MTCPHTTPSDQPRCMQCGCENPAYVSPAPLTAPEIRTTLVTTEREIDRLIAELLRVPGTEADVALDGLCKARQCLERAVWARDRASDGRAA